MFIFLSVFHFAIVAAVDILDKFLISGKKLLPYTYTFLTMVSGLIMLVAWPWVYASATLENIGISMFSGALFALAYYLFFKALSEGEVSRVIPFIFGIVPIFDVLLGLLLNINVLLSNEAAAIFLLVPGALLIAYKRDFVGKHVGLKIAAAAVFSIHAVVWQFAAKDGHVLNTLMWNRVGAAVFVALFLLVPQIRAQFHLGLKVKNPKQTSWLFVLKQVLGGSAFVLSSYLLATGKISIFSSLQGIRYAIIFAVAIFLTKKYRHILEEDINSHTLKQKLAGLVLVFIGTAILFIKL